MSKEAFAVFDAGDWVRAVGPASGTHYLGRVENVVTHGERVSYKVCPRFVFSPDAGWCHAPDLGVFTLDENFVGAPTKGETKFLQENWGKSPADALGGAGSTRSLGLQKSDVEKGSSEDARNSLRAKLRKFISDPTKFTREEWEVIFDAQDKIINGW